MRSLSPFMLVLALSLPLVGCQTLVERLRRDAGGEKATASTPDDSSGQPPTPPPSVAESSSSSGSVNGDPRVPSTGKAGAAKTGTTTAAAGLARALSPAELERAFADLDINKDKQLDGVEVSRCGCASADANGDREITKSEFFAWGLVPHRVTSGGSATPVPTPAPLPPTPTTTSTAATPSPPKTDPSDGRSAGAGLPVGEYHCFGIVGTQFGHRGQFKLLSASTYEVQGDGVQRYAFDPATKKIAWLTGLYSDRSKFRDAQFISGKSERITMQTGKDGFFTWDCTIGGR